MEQVQVEICMGTTCFVMGSSHLEAVMELLPPDLAARVNIQFSHCLGVCKDRNYGKAPFVKVGGRVISQATLPTVIEAIEACVRNLPATET